MVRLRPREILTKLYDRTTLANAYTSGVASLAGYEDCTVSMINRGVNTTHYRIHASPDIQNVPIDWVPLKAATALAANTGAFETLVQPWDAIRVSFVSGAVSASAYVRMRVKQ